MELLLQKNRSPKASEDGQIEPEDGVRSCPASGGSSVLLPLDRRKSSMAVGAASHGPQS